MPLKSVKVDSREFRKNLFVLETLLHLGDAWLPLEAMEQLSGVVRFFTLLEKDAEEVKDDSLGK